MAKTLISLLGEGLHSSGLLNLALEYVGVSLHITHFTSKVKVESGADLNLPVSVKK